MPLASPFYVDKMTGNFFFAQKLSGLLWRFYSVFVVMRPNCDDGRLRLNDPQNVAFGSRTVLGTRLDGSFAHSAFHKSKTNNF